VLRRNSLFANIDKCTFCVDSVVFLGFIVNQIGLRVDLEKIKAIQEWRTPQNVGDVKSFHGLTSFYRRFVPNFSSIASPLNELFAEPSGVQALKNPNPLKDVEAFAVLVVAVLVSFSFGVV